MPERSPAMERFWRSTQTGYEEWHDGIGYDLDAVREMTDAERGEVVAALRSQAPGSREVDVYAVVRTPDALAGLRQALECSAADTRLRAAAKLHALGEPIDLAGFVAKELHTVTIGKGMVEALDLAKTVPTPAVCRVLLREAGRRPEVGYHYAQALCLIAGIATDFEPEMRKFYRRLGERSSPEDRQAAFAELCERVGMRPDDGASD